MQNNIYINGTDKTVLDLGVTSGYYYINPINQSSSFYTSSLLSMSFNPNAPYTEKLDCGSFTDNYLNYKVTTKLTYEAGNLNREYSEFYSFNFILSGINDTTNTISKIEFEPVNNEIIVKSFDSDVTFDSSYVYNTLLGDKFNNPKYFTYNYTYSINNGESTQTFTPKFSAYRRDGLIDEYILYINVSQDSINSLADDIKLIDTQILPISSSDCLFQVELSNPNYVNNLVLRRNITPTPTRTVTPSLTKQASPTRTQTPTNSNTRTVTPTKTPSRTARPTPSHTRTCTPTLTQQPTPYITPTPTPTLTNTPTSTLFRVPIPFYEPDLPDLPCNGVDYTARRIRVYFDFTTDQFAPDTIFSHDKSYFAIKIGVKYSYAGGYSEQYYFNDLVISDFYINAFFKDLQVNGVTSRVYSVDLFIPMDMSVKYLTPVYYFDDDVISDPGIIFKNSEGEIDPNFIEDFLNSDNVDSFKFNCFSSTGNINNYIPGGGGPGTGIPFEIPDPGGDPGGGGPGGGDPFEIPDDPIIQTKGEYIISFQWTLNQNRLYCGFPKTTENDAYDEVGPIGRFLSTLTVYLVEIPLNFNLNNFNFRTENDKPIQSPYNVKDNNGINLNVLDGPYTVTKELLNENLSPFGSNILPKTKMLNDIYFNKVFDANRSIKVFYYWNQIAQPYGDDEKRYQEWKEMDTSGINYCNVLWDNNKGSKPDPDYPDFKSFPSYSRPFVELNGIVDFIPYEVYNNKKEYDGQPIYNLEESAFGATPIL